MDFKQSLAGNRKHVAYISLLIIILAFPLTLVLVRHQQNINSHAAAPDQLEAEGGVLGGNAKIQTDSLASGGNYVLFGGFSITTGPTSQNITVNSAEITWTLSEGATGQVEYGTTASYGTLSSPENSFTYSTHIQTLSGLSSNTTYHYRVKSSNQAGTQVVSGDKSFTTSASTSTGIYGSGIGVDSKSNWYIGGGNSAQASIRFRASTSSQLTKIIVQMRGGVNPDGSRYSDGTGGTVRVRLQTDDGTSNHRPSGNSLATLSFVPGNPTGGWGTFDTYTFPSPTSVTANTLYHLVFDNTDPAQTTNYVSINNIITFAAYTPRQPALSDDFAFLYADPSPFNLKPQETADIDIIYADGTHDGQAYSQSRCDIEGSAGIISGSSNMVREHFTVSGGNKIVTQAWVRVKRISGSGDLTLRLEKGDGTLIEQGTVPASSVSIRSIGCDINNEPRDWVNITFSAPQTLANTQTYNLSLSTAAGTEYIMTAVQVDNINPMLSRRFTDGKGQYTTDGGSSWNDIYLWAPFAPSMQFYFNTQ